MPRTNSTLLRAGGICLPLVLVAVAARSAMKPPANTPAISASVPSAEELDSLSKYLVSRPAQGLPVISSNQPADIDLADPFGSPNFAMAGDTVGGAVVTAPVADRWVVTAILISKDRRVAVINETLVSIGSTLPGGVRVTAIENDHVELATRSGARRLLSIKDSDAP